jgi:hypothetical protein
MAARPIDGPVGLGLPHALLLLELENTRGTSRLDMLGQAYGVCGAAVAELQVLGRLRPVRADVFALTSRASPPPARWVWPRSDRVASALPEGTLVALGIWGAGRLRTAFLEELVGAGLLRREADKLLFVTWCVRYPEENPALEQSLIAALRRYVDEVRADRPPGREDLLLSLLRGLRMLDAVWSEHDLTTVRRDRIDERTRLAPIGRDVRVAIREIEAGGT